MGAFNHEHSHRCCHPWRLSSRCGVSCGEVEEEKQTHSKSARGTYEHPATATTAAGEDVDSGFFFLPMAAGPTGWRHREGRCSGLSGRSGGERGGRGGSARDVRSRRSGRVRATTTTWSRRWRGGGVTGEGGWGAGGLGRDGCRRWCGRSYDGGEGATNPEVGGGVDG
uniref:Uncharacterized protein n=1 Tax=Oryza meridionalis TaxID=40149 RepID=A0A0E0F504_9ORYZ